MARKVLLTALVALTLWGSLPLAFAADSGTTDTTDSKDHFSSFDILNVSGDQGTTALPGEIQTAATATGGPGSLVAALILRIINILLLTIGTFAFVVIFYGGVLMIISNGDQSKIDRAKSILTQSLTGLVISFLAYYIVTAVQSFFY